MTSERRDEVEVGDKLEVPAGGTCFPPRKEADF